MHTCDAGTPETKALRASEGKGPGEDEDVVGGAGDVLLPKRFED